ncbi:permease [Thermosinus carboxydivorans Nor1]|uniref:Permease n=1 Tax=Thermosinus carboxydivorans Nor1 TaxID=401526 RepID=A1HQT6_9FIRM|nr:permease [Thermosinus carboxydivorans]EAX47646.1 permease [Thermosinus carboxydivorans Nor1]
MFQYIADYLTYQVFQLAPGSKLADAANFFIYDTMKIFFMLAVIVFVVAIIRTYFSPERTRQILSHKREFFGNISAALLGIVTPFCSCSAVPLFIGFLESGVPLGVTFSFLISSPMVNEIAVVLLWGMFGWKIAAIYMLSGLTVAIIAGMVIGKLKLEHLVEEYVFKMKVGQGQTTATVAFRDRVDYALSYTSELLRKIWPYVVVAIAIGGFIHGYAPADFLVQYAGKDNWFAVPLAVAIGVPLYSNAAGTIPIVYALVEKGMSIGTVLAFMMSVTALSLPEMIILRNVLKPKLIAVFVGIMTVTIIFTGYLFNTIL